MRTPLLACLTLGVLLLLGLGFGTFYYLNGQNRPARPADTIADEPAPATADADASNAEPKYIKPAEPSSAATRDTKTSDPLGAGASKAEIDPKSADKSDPAAENKDSADLKAAKLDALKKMLKDRGAQPTEGLEGQTLFLDDNRNVDFAATISGTVLDAAGMPVAGAGVFADVSEEQHNDDGNRALTTFLTRTLGGEEKPDATSDARGEFKIDVKRKIGERTTVVVTLSASCKGYAPSAKERIEVKNGDNKSGVNLNLRQAASVRGQVVAQDGRPVVGALVSLHDSKAMRYTPLDDGGEDLVFELGAQGNGMSPKLDLGSRNLKFSAKTDQGGNFEISDVPEATYDVSVKAAGFKASWDGKIVEGKPNSPQIKVVAGQACAFDAPLKMQEVSTLKFKLLDGDGKPLAGRVNVDLLSREIADAGKVVKSVRGTADKDGNVAISGLVAGEFDVVIKRRGMGDSSKVYAAIRDGQVTDLGVVSLVVDPDASKKPAEDPDRFKMVVPGK